MSLSANFQLKTMRSSEFSHAKFLLLINHLRKLQKFHTAKISSYVVYFLGAQFFKQHVVLKGWCHLSHMLGFHLTAFVTELYMHAKKFHRYN